MNILQIVQILIHIAFGLENYMYFIFIKLIQFEELSSLNRKSNAFLYNLVRYVDFVRTRNMWSPQRRQGRERERYLCYASVIEPIKSVCHLDPLNLQSFEIETK